jgi:hypothetical protein
MAATTTDCQMRSSTAKGRQTLRWRTRRLDGEDDGEDDGLADAISDEDDGGLFKIASSTARMTEKMTDSQMARS